MNKTDSIRLDSQDFTYSKGSYTYYDTYVLGEQFAGEEVIWHDGKPQYAMNYAGRVLTPNISGDFLKEELVHMSTEKSVNRSLKIRSLLTWVGACRIPAAGAVTTQLQFRSRFRCCEVFPEVCRNRPPYQSDRPYM